MNCGLPLLDGRLERSIVAAPQFGHSIGVDIETRDLTPRAESHSQRQADVAESDNGQRRVVAGGTQIGR